MTTLSTITALATAAATATISTSDAAKKAALEAALAAGHKAAIDLRIEAWILLAVAWVFIIFRTIGRFISVPISKFEIDDYLMLFAGLVYTTETTQIHFIAGLGGSNNMPPEIRASRNPEQIADHVTASKLFISGWVEYGLTVWLMKTCMCFFFKRLFQGLTDAQRKVRIALWMVCITYVIVFITTMCECVPFHKNWQVVPDPGSSCTQGLAKHIVILILNVATDVYLISIPLPIFIQSTMPFHRKVIITLLFGAGIFVTVAAILRSAFVFQDLYSSTLMAQWAVRESCVGFLVNNAPMMMPVFVQLRRFFFGDAKPSPFSTKDVINSIYSRSGNSAAKRKKQQKDQFMSTIGDADEEISLDENPKSRHGHHKSESAESINPGIRVDVEVQLQYNELQAEQEVKNNSKKRREMERMTSGHLAGKDKGNYVATIGGPPSRDNRFGGSPSGS